MGLGLGWGSWIMVDMAAGFGTSSHLHTVSRVDLARIKVCPSAASMPARLALFSWPSSLIMLSRLSKLCFVVVLA